MVMLIDWAQFLYSATPTFHRLQAALAKAIVFTQNQAEFLQLKK
jgi:hypothetical protein